MTDCHIVLYKKSNSIDVLHTKEMDKYQTIIEEHYIAAHTPKKDLFLFKVFSLCTQCKYDSLEGITYTCDSNNRANNSQTM